MKIILTIGLLILTSFPAAAQHKLDGTTLRSDEAVQDAEKLYEDLKAIVAELEEQDQRHFLGIYSTYSTISAIKTVRKNVEKTVKLCGKENPDLKDKMNGRYKDWNKTLTPVLKEAKAQVDNMIIAQDYAKRKTIRTFLKRVDSVRDKTEKSLNKVPITTEEGCNHLHDKMDETQETLTTLLQETLISIPRTIGTAKQVRKAEEEERKAAEKAKEDAEKETEKAQEE